MLGRGLAAAFMMTRGMTASPINRLDGRGVG